MTLGIFGAQGHFGSSLYKRLQDIKPGAVELIPTVDKERNKEIAGSCDLVVICVQPKNVLGLISEIAPFLKPEAQILSFAARVPMDHMTGLVSHPVARGIADPWWKVSAFYFGRRFSTQGLEFIFEHLTKEKSLVAKSDAEMHGFTVLNSHLFVTLLLEKLGRMPNVDHHLRFLASKLSLPKRKLTELIPSGDPEELIKLMATKGGITEKIVQTIEAHPDIEPEQLFEIAAK
jgi:pyrroline-5-carboxylate reductase